MNANVNTMVLATWVVYVVGLAVYPLVEVLVSGHLFRPGRCVDPGLEYFSMLVRSVFWPVIVVGWLWVLWAKTLNGVGEWVHNWLADEYNKHRRGK